MWTRLGMRTIKRTMFKCTTYPKRSFVTVLKRKDKMRAAEKALRRGMSNATAGAANSILSFPKRHPYPFNIMLATVKTSACDVLVQKYIEKRDEIDWKRNAVFVAFGCLYLGVFQWFIYVNLFGRWFPQMAKFANQPFRDKIKNKEGLKDLCKQVAFDNFVHYTFIYFPVFYVFKEAIQGYGYEKTVTSVASVGLGKYKDNFVEDNTKMYLTWIPGDFIIYAVPMWLRLPTNHGLSFLWTCYLSFLRGDAIEEEDEQQPNIGLVEEKKPRESKVTSSWLRLAGRIVDVPALENDERAVERFFHELDLDKNGSVSTEELRSALEHVQSEHVQVVSEDDGADVERAALRRAIMAQLLAATVGTSLVGDASAMIRAADADSDGEVDLDELKQLVKKVRAHRRMIRSISHDNAKAWLELSRNVFAATAAENEKADVVDAFFDALDLDKDGKIDISELKESLHRFSKDSKKHARRVVESADFDDDGDIDRAEIRRAILAHLVEACTPVHRGDPGSMLDIADIDSDGKIDRAELRRVMKSARKALDSDSQFAFLKK